MPVIADIISGNIGIILGYLSCSHFSGFKPLNFIVDTGSVVTTILPLDVLKLGINCDKLKKGKRPLTTAKGEVFPHILPNVIVNLTCNDGRKDAFEMFPLGSINCVAPSASHRKDSQGLLKHTFSLLGMDVLQYFQKMEWNFNDKTLKLDHV